ncbi:MAG: cyclase family protein [Gemmataceae bacterium]|nr:cyclase family protein [Gemmataceae bacterium]
MRIVDLSVTLGGPTFVEPAFFPPVVFEQIHTHEVHKKLNSKLNYPIHTGTHADSPYHSVPDGEAIDEISLDRFIGPAVRIDLREFTRPSTPITLEQLQSAAPEGVSLRDRIVALNSGWLGRMYGTQEYYDQYPSYTAEAVRWLIDQEVRAVAIDCAIDSQAATTVEGGFGNHRLLGRAGIPLIENVANLDQLPTEFEFIGFPAKFHRCDGAPVRAVAIVRDGAGASRATGAQAEAASDSGELPPGYDARAFGLFKRYFTEREARRFFEFVRAKDEAFFQLWQAWVPGGMYSRTVLEQKTREFCAIASSVALNALPQVRAHVTGALYAGASPAETLEVILQQGVYAGLPYAMQALGMWEQAVEAFQKGEGYGGLST